jgi:hypothetical protein
MARCVLTRPPFTRHPVPLGLLTFISTRSVSALMASVLCCLFLTATGQKQYDGPYTLPDGSKGHAFFQYRMAGNDTVPVGPWAFRSAWTDTTVIDEVHSISIIGRYDAQGMRSDDWAYSRKRLVPVMPPMVRDYQVVSNAHGEEHAVLGRFKEGAAEGRWQVVDRNVIGSALGDTLLLVEVDMKQGVPAGQLTGRIDGVVLNGSFDEAGMLHGEWRFEHRMKDGRRVNELRSYTNGVLQEHVLQVGNKRYPLRWAGSGYVQADDADLWTVQAVDAQYFRMLEYISQGPSPADAVAANLPKDSVMHLIRRSNSTYLEALQAMGHDGESAIWMSSPGGGTPGTGMVRMRKFPLTADEQEAVGQIRRAHRQANETVVRLLKDPMTDLGRHAYEQVEALYAVLQIYRVQLDLLAPYVKVLTDPAIDLIDRGTLLPVIAPSVHLPASVTYEFKEQRKEQPHGFPQVPDTGLADVLATRDLLLAMQQDIKDSERQLAAILDKYKTQSKLRDKETLLVAMRDSITQLFDKSTELDPYRAMMADAMIAMAQSQFKQYGELGLDQKVERIDDLLQCFENATEVYRKLGRVPLRIERIEDLYTRSMWNPHTFTYMDEHIKERIYRAYDGILLPLVLKDMRENVTCGKLLQKQQNVVDLYQKMITLRDEDTRDIERQLRRVSDPAEIMRIISLELQLD